MKIYHTDIQRIQSYSLGATTSENMDRHDATINSFKIIVKLSLKAQANDQNKIKFYYYTWK